MKLKKYLSGYLLFYALVAVLLAQIVLILPANDVTVVVDADIESGVIIETFFNQDWDFPDTASRREGRQTYKFHYKLPPFPVEARLTDLRLDLTHYPGVKVVLHSVKIIIGSAEPILISGCDLIKNSWQANISQVECSSVDKSVTFVPSSGDPIISWKPNLISPESSIVRSISKWLESQLWWYLLILGVITTLLMEYFAKGRDLGRYYLLGLAPLGLAIGLPVTLSRIYSSRLIHIIPDLYLPVSEAVGQAAILGYPKGRENLVFASGILLAAAAALAAFFVYWAFGLGNKSAPSESEPEISPKKYDFLKLFLAVFLLTLPTIPNIKEVFNPLFVNGKSEGWDYLNLASWSYYRHLGLQSFKDFWFPYGLAGFLYSKAPLDILYSQLHRFLIALVIVFSFHALFRKGLVTSLIFSFLLILVRENETFQAVDRYMLPISLILFAAAYLFSERARIIGLGLGLWASYVFIMEPSQLVYSIPGLAALFFGSLVISGERNRLNELLRAIYPSFIAFIVPTLCFIGILLIQGRLGAVIDTYARMASCTVYCSTDLPGGVEDWFKRSLTHIGYSLRWLLIFFGLGIFFFLTSRNKNQKEKSLAVVALVTIGLMVFLKLIVRPHIINHILPIIYVTGIICFTLFISFHNPKQRAVLLVWGLLFVRPQMIEKYWTKIIRAPHQISETFDTLLFEARTPREAYETLFSWSNLVQEYPWVQGVKEILDNVSGVIGRPPKVFVLGDESYIYNGLRQIPPKYINLYNTSNIWDQKELVSILSLSQPDVVIYSKASTEFDLVPNQVRTPIIHSYVIGGHALFAETPRFVFLAPRQNNLDTLVFWQNVFGSELKLGGIPAASKLGAAKECSSDPVPSDCVPVWEFQIDNSLFTEKYFSPRFKNGKTKISAKIQVIPSADKYQVRADRLWFWSLRKRWRVILPKGVKGKLVYRQLDRDSLY